ncbi:hypothetical protein D8674_037594 [Pyrus ussuriensis x Pyrus communis]|uniref:Replication factor A C-terminal domain-containing protein n=1 Tax=Pyrus ussuriensis x Pyrus communis TaxID=2448454 RepID=A0A5N5FMS1_9ROSA|nr:hypothetical protein D8674_037594 [Pyrus ussuriensis x Pyrus communis]
MQDMKSTIPGTVQKYTALNCILVDEMQDAIEATTLNVEYDVMVAKIEASGCYEIIDFRTSKIRGQYKVVPHETQVLFNAVTKFKKLASVFPPIPRHRFFLQDYNTLTLAWTGLTSLQVLLTYVSGCIRAVQSLEEKQINQRVAYKCDVHIQNIRKEELTVTLWADIGEAFSSLSTEAFSLPVVVVFTSLKVRRYLGNIVLNSTGSSLFFIDPDIPEVNSYKSVFSNCKEFPKILPPSSDQANEDETFLCKAAVKHFDTRYDWWYSAWPICVKQMHKDPTTAQLICQKHPNQIPTPWYKVNLILEDETNEIDALIIGKCGEKLFGMSCKDLVLNQTLVDHQQLPNEFLRLIGQKKIFHLRFGNRRNNFNPSNVLIQNVIDYTTMQPATPLPLPREITGSSTTVSSSTSSAETTEQSNKRKRESIKRTLFTNNEQREMEEVSEADPREFDEVPIKLLKKKSSPTSGKLGTTPEKTN